MKKFPLLLLSLITIVAYFPILQNEFCLDDAIVSSLPYEKLTIWRLFTQPIPHQLLDNYRPLAFFTFVIDHALWNSPIGYHCVNIVWQILAAFCVYLLAKEILPQHAITAAILFAVLPGHSEAVISIYNRCQVISSISMFLALWLSFRYLEKPKRLLL
jgi:ABC-type glycerol-3-phosphate transport system permease component